MRPTNLQLVRGIVPEIEGSTDNWRCLESSEREHLDGVSELICVRQVSPVKLHTSVRLGQDGFERSLYFCGLRRLRVAFSTVVERLKASVSYIVLYGARHGISSTYVCTMSRKGKEIVARHVA